MVNNSLTSFFDQKNDGVIIFNHKYMDFYKTHLYNARLSDIIIIMVTMFSPVKMKNRLSSEKAVDKNKIKEIYYITHADNIPSIMNLGVLSHNRAIQQKVFNPKLDISNPEVQSLRAKKEIHSSSNESPRSLHDYVPLYPQPFNAMMAAVAHSKQNLNLCVLRISSDILNKPGTLMTNINAACHEAKFFKPAEWTLPLEEFEAVRSLSLQGSDSQKDKESLKRYRRARQFEVLVLDFVLPNQINGIFVPNERLKQDLEAKTGGNLPIEVNPSLFLRSQPQPYQHLQLFKPLQKRKNTEHPHNAFELIMASHPASKKPRGSIRKSISCQETKPTHLISNTRPYAMFKLASLTPKISKYGSTQSIVKG
jgi:hypothetical protein